MSQGRRRAFQARRMAARGCRPTSCGRAGGEGPGRSRRPAPSRTTGRRRRPVARTVGRPRSVPRDGWSGRPAGRRGTAPAGPGCGTGRVGRGGGGSRPGSGSAPRRWPGTPGGDRISTVIRHEHNRPTIGISLGGCDGSWWPGDGHDLRRRGALPDRRVSPDGAAHPAMVSVQVGAGVASRSMTVVGAPTAVLFRQGGAALVRWWSPGPRCGAGAGASWPRSWPSGGAGHHEYELRRRGRTAADGGGGDDRAVGSVGTGRRAVPSGGRPGVGGAGHGWGGAAGRWGWRPRRCRHRPGVRGGGRLGRIHPAQSVDRPAERRGGSLGLAMAVAAALVAPFGLRAGAALVRPDVLVRGAVVGCWPGGAVLVGAGGATSGAGPGVRRADQPSPVVPPAAGSCCSPSVDRVGLWSAMALVVVASAATVRSSSSSGRDRVDRSEFSDKSGI